MPLAELNLMLCSTAPASIYTNFCPPPQVNKEAEHRERLQELQQRIVSAQERIFSGGFRDCCLAAPLLLLPLPLPLLALAPCSSMLPARRMS